jgi:FtsZ-binding cell division protein ZapB
MSSSDELLVKCKEKIEQLYKEVEDFKDANRDLGSEKQRLEQENETLRITSKGFKGLHNLLRGLPKGGREGHLSARTDCGLERSDRERFCYRDESRDTQRED